MIKCSKILTLQLKEDEPNTSKAVSILSTASAPASSHSFLPGIPPMPPLEDDEEEKIKIFPWALGRALEGRIPLFLAHRDEL